MDEAAFDVPPPKKKRSLFSRKISNELVVAEEPIDEVDFFSRAKELYPIHLVEEKRKKRERGERKLERIERKRSTESAELKTHDSPDKWRRVSDQADDEKGDVFEEAESFKSSRTTPGDMGPPPTKESEWQPLTTTITGRYSRELNKNNYKYICIDNDDEDIVAVHNKSISTIDDDDEDIVAIHRNSISITDDDEPEIQEKEELPHLVERARQRQRQLKEMELKKAAALADNDDNSINVDEDEDLFAEDQTGLDETPVKILITCGFVDTAAPLILLRKMWQPLKVVREVWCDRAIKSGAIPEAMKNSLILTWKYKQLYDVSTCSSLITRGSSDALDEEGRLHLEIWSYDTLQAHLEKQAEPTPEPEEAAPVIKYKMVLKGARDKESLKLRCEPSSLVQKLVDYYRMMKGLSDDAQITMYFDGEELEPDMKLEDTELAEEAAEAEPIQVEVYVS
ncbi:hypothetical protein BJ878DRAFT_542142 [Calycina marina]|uniref:Rad60/SUMO-like domain-containing protein n=1 Tax=Calycina marina TaxID=1763456 RepID=A0A9P7Z474_9HELO|nr:hypothetical protein BJ878DRAFT_542142 [Calycina marina]